MIYKAVRRLQFCCGHRVYKHESKCANMHGHNYVLLIQASYSSLDSIGRVIDFTDLKNRFGTWIDNNWDHGFVYFEKDDEMKSIFQHNKKHKSFAMPLNPTAENMAEYLLCDIAPKLMQGTGLTVDKITLWETENCFAEVSND